MSSQFVDGALLATEPYVSGAAHIDRLSDYCKGCAYDKKQCPDQRFVTPISTGFQRP